MTTTASPTRRVLGPKDPNAPLHQQASKLSDRMVQAASPASQRQSQEPIPPASCPGSPRSGQKRKFEEVHDEGQMGSQKSNHAHPLSQATELLSDTQSDHGEITPPSLVQSKSTISTTFSSFRASQEEHQVEPEFHIHEEPSQQTLDNMV